MPRRLLPMRANEHWPKEETPVVINDPPRKPDSNSMMFAYMINQADPQTRDMITDMLKHMPHMQRMDIEQALDVARRETNGAQFTSPEFLSRVMGDSGNNMSAFLPLLMSAQGGNKLDPMSLMSMLAPMFKQGGGGGMDISALLPLMSMMGGQGGSGNMDMSKIMGMMGASNPNASGSPDIASMMAMMNMMRSSQGGEKQGGGMDIAPLMGMMMNMMRPGGSDQNQNGGMDIASLMGLMGMMNGNQGGGGFDMSTLANIMGGGGGELNPAALMQMMMNRSNSNK